MEEGRVEHCPHGREESNKETLMITQESRERDMGALSLSKGGTFPQYEQ